MSDLVVEIDQELQARSEPERAARQQAYLKSDLVHYGATVPVIRAVATGVRRAHPDLDHDQLVTLVEQLWSAPVHERRMVAIELLVQHTGLLGARDLDLLERLLRESCTWALVDPLSIWVVGAIIERDPAAADALDRWAVDDDRWIRRAALLALLPGLHRGAGDFDRFDRYADPLLEDKDPFIRKAIGWVLRDTARRRPQLVFDWLAPRASRASGVTLREAVKALPDEQREAILAAR